jgi:methyl-accepting chemotaxis protein
VQDILGELAGQQGIEPQLKSRIERLRDEHRQLGAAYQKGRDAYLAAGADPTAGDTAVKGVDRATSDQMSALVSELRQQGDQSKQLSASAVARCCWGSS